jgi:penicillin-binding protein 1A
LSDDHTFPAADDSPRAVSRARARAGAARPTGGSVARRWSAAGGVAGEVVAPDARRRAPAADGDGDGAAPGRGGGNGSDGGGGRLQPPARGGRGADSGRPRVHKLRLALILAGLGGLAVLSTVFGMVMAVASDLPALENRQEYRNARNSVLLDDHGTQIGILTSRDNRILVQTGQVSPAMQHAIIAIEDQRFYDNNGVDVRAIGRAFFADLLRRRTVQGASTISQQFVKNALAAQNQRTLFQKLRESALAYHLNRKWSKQKILTEYLNAVYFGNGAYGIESAARVYFSIDPLTGQRRVCGGAGQPLCASLLNPAEAALLSGMVSSPSAYDPLVHPGAAQRRREAVLERMRSEGYIGSADLSIAQREPIPTRATVTFPHENSLAPYFTTWVKQQVIERFGAQRALNGGLRIRTTLDLELQRQAEQAVANHLSDPNGPAAALVAIDNRSGQVRAMVGGRPGLDYNSAPFNLATQGQRQPGSAFKAFVLAQALRKGVSPDSVWASQRKIFDVPHGGGERFVVRNFEGEYAGARTLAEATAESDNSVFAEVGIKVGPPKIALLARRMGIRTPVSSNYAITLGGLKQGVTPLDMAHAYQTIAAHGRRVTGTLGALQDGPVGIREVDEPGGRRIVNQTLRHRVLSSELADTETEILKSVVCCGTGKEAATGGFAAGKTGTTENYGDAWFVGFNRRWTVAVWVGYPDRLKPMKYDFGGSPVVGGSYPAEIWHDFIVAADQIQNQREAERAAREGREYVPPDESGGADTTGIESGYSSSGSSDGGSDESAGSGASGTGSSGDSSSAGTDGGGGDADSGDGGGGGGGGGPPSGGPSSGSGGGATGGSGASGGTAPQG